MVIPASDLSEMGLIAGQSVFVAYIADGGLINQYQEFVVSATTLSELGVSQQITIPQLLLEQANIGPEAEVQVTCMEGAIIITGDTALSEIELKEVVDRLQAANDLSEYMGAEYDTAEGGAGDDNF